MTKGLSIILKITITYMYNKFKQIKGHLSLYIQLSVCLTPLGEDRNYAHICNIQMKRIESKFTIEINSVNFHFHNE